MPLAESIADGAPIDWDAAEAGASERERVVIRQLRVLSSLAGLHRSQPPAAHDATGPAPDRHALATPAIGSWAQLTLIERLGGGAFGDVYRAWDRHLEREVALKLLRADEAIDDLHASRIAREGRLLARVRHANVITVHGVDAHDGRVGLWMELVRGVTLEEQIATRGPLSAREAASVGIDLCRALAAIHAAGLIHRDVKAQNVMREDGGRIVLMDLGTGREADVAGRPSAPDLAGTPLYLAPEILDGAPASERTDLYSLGVLLYHVVTGSFPVRATTIQELHDGHHHGRPLRLRDARADLPTPFVRVVDRAIAADPEERYATAGAFEADLARALDESAVAHIVPERTAGSRATVPLAAAAAVILLTLAVPAIRTWLAPAPIRLAARDAILVADFANLTGESVFDGTLKEAVTVQLQQSPYLNAFGARSVEIATPADGRVQTPAESAAAARDLCNRRHMKAMVLGSIATAGDGFVVSVTAQNCQTGEVIARGEGAAPTRAGVLRALGAATAGLRQQLGDSSATNQQFNVPVEEATTASLDALKSYSLGMETRARVGDAEAIPFFNHAVELDPGFALAEGKLASIYANLHEFEKSQAHTRSAFALSDHGTERERLYIRASYHLHVTGNLEEAAGAYQLWIRLYPQDWLPHSNLGAVYGRAARFDDAVVELNRGRALGPDQLLPYLQLAQTAVLLGRFADAESTITAARARGLDSADFRALMLSLALVNGGVDAARKELELPANRAKEYLVLAAAARAEAFSGDVAAARGLLAQAVAKAKGAQVNDVAAALLAQDGLTAAVTADYAAARTTVDRALAIGRGSDTLWAASLANAFAGRRAAAVALAQEYTRVTPPTTEVVAMFAPVLQAGIALAKNDAAGAVDALQAATPYERLGGFWPAYLRGLAYLRLKRPIDAAAQFREILAHRGDDPASVLYPLAALQTGRARAAARDSKAAADAYEQFFKVWRGANRSQPLVAAAIRERASLPH